MERIPALRRIGFGAVLAVLGVAQLSSPAEAAMATARFDLSGTCDKAEVLACEGGAGVVCFDLSALPKGGEIYRADLVVRRSAEIDGTRDEALVDIEVLPLFEAFAGGEPGGAGRPLALRGPWFDRFDATDAVRRWTAGKPNGGFFFKVCPLWNREATCLDVCYESQPEKEHAPAQVSGVQAFHRSGQTFITWREIEDPVGKGAVTWGEMRLVLERLDRDREVRYAVYRHDCPITAKTLPRAEFLALVKPASGWNVNGRNIEKAIDEVIATREVFPHGHWNPFATATMDGDFGKDCPLERLVIEPGGKPLEGGTGLYVHTAVAKDKAYYAVLTVVDGVQNTVDLSEKNVTTAIREAPAEPQPVLQKEFPRHPYFNYPEKRLHYVRWEAPANANLPGQYYNWSVAVPDEVAAAGSDPARRFPLELNLHMDDRSYQRTAYRIEPDSILVTPHDFPRATWWYGHHESLGTLRSFRQGVIQPYTERRVLSFVNWAAANWPVDRSRIFVTAQHRRSGGAAPSAYGGASSGALHLALRHPEVFCAVFPSYLAHPDYAAVTDPRARSAMSAIWGKAEWGLKTDSGASVWDEQNLNRLLAGMPATADLPLVTLTGEKAPQPVLDFIALMLERGQGVIADFRMYSGPKLVPVSLNGTWPASVMIRGDVRKGLVLPAFGRSGAAAVRASADKFAVVNRDYRWNSADIVDRRDRVEITVWREGRKAEPVADVTLRRLRNFRVVPGKTYAWANNAPDGAEVEKGEVSAGADGLLTVRDFKISDKGSRLVVTAK